MNSKPILIDGKDHLVGRLAAVVAKQLLQGQPMTIVRCEKLILSGSFHRNRLKFQDYLNKRCNVNPKRGPIHFRAPSKIFHKAVRGMVPHKTRRGKRALALLTVCEGVPPKYSVKKRLFVPSALKSMRLRPGRKFCCVERLSHEVGWKYRDVVNALEAKRKVRSKQWYKTKMEKQKYINLARKKLMLAKA